MRCPKCGNKNHNEFAIERSPHGSTTCMVCDHRAKHDNFQIPKISQENGMVTIEVIVDRIAYKKSFTIKEFLAFGTASKAIEEVKKKYKGDL